MCRCRRLRPIPFRLRRRFERRRRLCCQSYGCEQECRRDCAANHPHLISNRVIRQAVPTLWRRHHPASASFIEEAFARQAGGEDVQGRWRFHGEVVVVVGLGEEAHQTDFVDANPILWHAVDPPHVQYGITEPTVRGV